MVSWHTGANLLIIVCSKLGSLLSSYVNVVCGWQMMLCVNQIRYLEMCIIFVYVCVFEFCLSVCVCVCVWVRVCVLV